MKNYSIIYGVDISKDTLDICELNPTSPGKKKHYRIENDFKSIRKFLSKASDPETIFCMEDTGVYGYRLCGLLESKGVDYAVVPAIQIKRSKGLRRGKNDKIDAGDIAEYVLTHAHDISLSQLPEEDLQELKLLMSERNKLIKAIKMFGSSEENFAYSPKSIVVDAKSQNHKIVKYLKKQLSTLEKKIAALIAENKTMNHQNELLQSIPGVGPQTAMMLISYTRCFKDFSNWRKMACYAGLAPFEYQSGTSVRGRSKVSHFAQKQLKSVIHMAALTAKRLDPELSDYYQRKVDEGKNKMLVMNAVRCKVIARAFAVIKRDSPYVNTQKYTA